MVSDADIRRAPALNAVMPSAELGMLLFIPMEIMFFAGLISAFLVLRADGAATWPPAGQPRLPVVVTGINTFVLLLSGVAAERGVAALRNGGRSTKGWLGAAIALGATFLAIQGVEWIRLVGFGLTMTSSLYGATFYVLIGVHGCHVAGGLVGLVVVFARVLHGPRTPSDDEVPRMWRMYWWFVVGIWPVLYGLVYF
jgi:heme/copper-type cytochrome/quinol oxidase subunit 3